LTYGGELDEIVFNFDIQEIFSGKVPIHYEIHIESGGSGGKPKITYEFLETNTDLIERTENEATFQGKEKSSKKELNEASELAIFQVKDQTEYIESWLLWEYLKQWTSYVPLDVGWKSPLRWPQLWQGETFRLLPDGSNLFSVLKSIQDQEPSVWEEVNHVLRITYPNFHHLTLPDEGGDGRIFLRWWERPFTGGYNFSANLLSDGTVRLLFLLAILKSPHPPSLICLEEPEFGLHPEWIKLLGELLEEAATRTQIIVATHSPTLISYVKPQHVVVVEKEDGATYMERLTEAEMADWLGDFQLGELWVAGHIGGRP
jgi:predicted ATPase